MVFDTHAGNGLPKPHVALGFPGCVPRVYPLRNSGAHQTAAVHRSTVCSSQSSSRSSSAAFPQSSSRDAGPAQPTRSASVGALFHPLHPVRLTPTVGNGSDSHFAYHPDAQSPAPSMVAGQSWSPQQMASSYACYPIGVPPHPYQHLGQGAPSDHAPHTSWNAGHCQSPRPTRVAITGAPPSLSYQSSRSGCMRVSTPPAISVSASGSGSSALIAQIDVKLDEIDASCNELKRLSSQLASSGEQPPTTHREPLRPACMASRDSVTNAMKLRQKTAPEKWTLSVKQWISVMKHILDLPEYKLMKKNKRTVSMYDVNDMIVKAWSSGTGCGISILVSQGVDLVAADMLSHAWGEDAEELFHAVQGLYRDEHRDLDLSLWFCVFANYQPEDGAGPSIQAQLKMEPFATVIKHCKLVIAVHTTKADLYSRLWCVHEVERSTDKGCGVIAAMSDQYINDVVRRVKLHLDEGGSAADALDAADVSVRTIKARCGNAADEKMLVRQVMMSGGFAHLDQVVSSFRRRMLPEEVMRVLVRQDGSLFEGFAEKLGNQPEFVMAGIRQNPAAVRFAHNEIWKDANFTKEVDHEIKTRMLTMKDPGALLQLGESLMAIGFQELAVSVLRQMDVACHMQQAVAVKEALVGAQSGAGRINW